MIQKAVDEVSSLEMDGGFRGAVQLTEGTFKCAGTIYINSSGIILRGSGVNGTIIKMIGDKHTAFIIGSNNKSEESVSVKTFISDNYVASGAIKFNVTDAKSFHGGDIIEIKRPVTEAWVKFMEMHNLVRDGKPQTWLGTDRYLIMKRKIINVSGNTITVDTPLSDSFDAQYLNPPGTAVTKINAVSKITQVGIENIRIQCPPLEIEYGKAPYSAIRIGGDDCWVKDIYCEETMNNIVITGNRVTLQKVIAKHTYPNLGASKPTDFSIEGSQILIDRCEVTGDNEYFVWTSSLAAGPNVILNSTFLGRGSRIQPHHRWSTGMLIDNCSVPGGGIDFPNRGVAGSGHGWTMGWGVVWNSIAKFYVIQNPPCTLNWAIGCIGERLQTARYFDTSPLLDEGIFESHGTPVAPQSLYLAQLQERLGNQALVNIGYAANDITMFDNKSVEPLPEYKPDIDEELGENLGLYRPIDENNRREDKNKFSGEKAVDGNDETYWALDDDKRI